MIVCFLQYTAAIRFSSSYNTCTYRKYALINVQILDFYFSKHSDLAPTIQGQPFKRKKVMFSAYTKMVYSVKLPVHVEQDSVKLLNFVARFRDVKVLCLNRKLIVA